MIVSAHQSHYFPWLGYLDKLFNCDLFVVLDTCDFRKNYYQNRVQIKTYNGAEWITVPVGKHQQPICDMKIDNGRNWMRKQCRTIQFAYKDCLYFKKNWEIIKNRIFNFEWYNLRDLDFETLKLAIDLLQIDIPVIKASDLKATGKKDDWIVNMCLELGADTYLFGKSGKDYYNAEKFEKNGIKVLFQDFKHPVYEQQQFKGQYYFIEGLSYLDGLFNLGAEGLRQLLCN